MSRHGTDRGDRNEKTITQLTELLDGIERRVTTSQRIAALDERNRLTLLFGHALFAMLVVPGFALLSQSGMSSPSFAVAKQVPGAPYSLAVWIGVGGFALAVATVHRNRRGEFYALAVLGAWYVMFSISLMAAIAMWMSPAVESAGITGFVGDLDWTRAPSIYAPVVYGHLAYAMGEHMRTLYKRGLDTDRNGPQ